MNNSIVFVDPNVDNFRALEGGLAAGTEVVVLDGDGDRLEQMRAHLAGRRGVASLHVVSHGTAGALHFGDIVADEASLSRHRSALADIGKSLAPEGDILLYGCNVAAGPAGASFVGRIAALTGANVAASATRTGATTLGGDAELEFRVGAVTTAPLFSQAAFDTAGIVLGNLPVGVTPGSEGVFLWADSLGRVSRQGTINLDQVLIAAFEVDESGSGFVNMKGDGSFDGMLAVYDKDGRDLTGPMDNAGAGGTEGKPITFVAGQIYYAAIAGYKTSTGSFTLTAGFNLKAPQPIVTAAPDFAGVFGGGRIDPPGDSDFFSLTAPASATTLALTVSPGVGLDAVVTLYNSAGEVVRTFNNGGHGSVEGNPSISITGGQSYQVGVHGATRADVDDYLIKADFNPDQAAAPAPAPTPAPTSSPAPAPGTTAGTGTSGADVLTGGSGKDALTGLGGNDTLDGGGGIDTAVYTGVRSNYSLASFGTVLTVRALTGTEGTDTLTNVERLKFSDTSVAMDLDGNAGLAAKIIGVVFGPQQVSNTVFVGIGLSFLDGGMSYDALMKLALGAAGLGRHADEVNALWTNIFGSAPTAAQAAPFVQGLDAGTFTPSGLAISAAELAINATNIGLAGLHLTGLAYAPFG